jgi:hypothetical protein
MSRQKTLCDFNHVGLPLLAESNLKHQEIVELVSSLKDLSISIDTALLASCPSSILQADHVAHMVLVIEVQVLIQVILETPDIYEHYITGLYQCDLLISQDFGFSC